MKQKRKNYTKEYKQTAVGLVSRGDRTKLEIAESLEIDQSQLGRWCKAFKQEGVDAFRGKGNRKALEDEIFSLKKDNERLRKEAEFLKKASAYFAKEML